MASSESIQRRKRGGPGRRGEGLRTFGPVRAEDSSTGGLSQEAFDVARYVADMTAQLEAMAIAARLDLLAYFLGMAKAESELFVRTNPVAEANARDDEVVEAETEDESYKRDSFD